MKSYFQKSVKEVVAKIPAGSVMSYKEVAEAAGFPGAYRAVGTVLRNNHDPNIHCHRVIKSNGEPGGYNGGEREKELRLRAEGARLDSEKNIKYTITGKFGVQNKKD